MSPRDHVFVNAPGDPRVVEVAVGGLSIACHPKRLMTPALGSCVGVALWDGARGLGGLAHVMLPRPGRTASDPENGRFASWAIPELVRLLIESGVDPRYLRAKIAGGAAMFGAQSDNMPIGERNVAEVRSQLELAGIPLCAQDTGGSHARTVELHLDSGILLVRSYRFGVRRL